MQKKTKKNNIIDMASCENEPEGVDSTLMKNREDISPLKTSNGDIDDEHDIQGDTENSTKKVDFDVALFFSYNCFSS
jgi:hypothetical protein